MCASVTELKMTVSPQFCREQWELESRKRNGQHVRFRRVGCWSYISRGPLMAGAILGKLSHAAEKVIHTIITHGSLSSAEGHNSSSG